MASVVCLCLYIEVTRSGELSGRNTTPLSHKKVNQSSHMHSWGSVMTQALICLMAAAIERVHEYTSSLALSLPLLSGDSPYCTRLRRVNSYAL